MWELLLIGLIGGLVTGLSPCILPVLSIVFAVSADKNRRPILVATGIAISFTLVTLLGTVVLEALRLPPSTLRWLGVALLVVVGLSMMWPALNDALERPFTRIRIPSRIQGATRKGGSGFGVGLALGAVYSPCAGPVLAAVTVAGATGEIGWGNVALAVSFAAGACTPLFFFALAGKKMSARAAFVRTHRTAIARAAGALIIALAVAIALNLPAALQRVLPDWTAGIQDSFNSSSHTRDVVNSVQGAAAEGGASAFDECRGADPGQAQDCGEVPELVGLGEWLNTEEPIDPRRPAEGTSVTLVDFWAYACINCQRANEHLTKLYDRYRDAGLTVVGIHAPEYAFEHDVDNVRAAVREQNIHYPVVQDNDFATWRAFHNRYWPAHYLVDDRGRVRQIHEGEGAYTQTEQLVRELLTRANPGIDLPEPVEPGVAGSADGGAPADAAEAPGAIHRNPETYLGTQRARYFDHPRDQYRPGCRDFAPTEPKDRRYALEGPWQLGEEFLTPGECGAGLSRIRLNYAAAHVQLVVSGRGTIRVEHRDGRGEEFPVTADGSVDLVKGTQSRRETVSITIPQGLRVYSFTFG
ncbi:redoxin domain-containing protein [Corynebacterium sp. zg-331]|uniref:cytochrome c biogenesis protein CcdA n=1 Tax=unclassified Corynebacterium TaxID=2624378 RepID=UPI00128CF10D|nr:MULTISPECIES: cytochrome c biogenesis protein CcdA [unclassified Corynebacterium]MBC3186670.1 redoxin domain-containing protein [Corynebacterium sp. zg-331]MPV53154.1 redoxin domain-containing protein [Corynebacterium sp. zg331]